MKTILYFLIFLFVFSLIPFDALKATPHIYILQCADGNVTASVLEQSAAIFSERLKQYNQGDFRIAVDVEKKQIRVQITGKSDEGTVQLLTHKGSITFKDAATHETLMNKQSIESIKVNNDSALEIQLKSNYVPLWKTIIENHIHKIIELYCDDQLVYNPVVKDTISNGSCVITGNFKPGELRLLQIIGSIEELPVTFILVE